MTRPKAKTVRGEEKHGRKALFVAIDASLFEELNAACARYRHDSGAAARRIICEEAIRRELSRLRVRDNRGRDFRTYSKEAG